MSKKKLTEDTDFGRVQRCFVLSYDAKFKENKFGNWVEKSGKIHDILHNPAVETQNRNSFENSIFIKYTLISERYISDYDLFCTALKIII